MNDLVQRVESAIQSRRLLKPRQKLLVAVSGGLDSMVLLEVLRQLAPAHHWQLFVAHFNHRLRGAGSQGDERLVRTTAAKLKIPCLVGQADVLQAAEEQRLSLEMAARRLRHRFLARLAVEHGCKSIALAHQSDDQVELFFLRLLRGAGAAGLAGMKWISPSPALPSLTLVRPLLDCPKADLWQFAREAGVRFREDASNASLDILRNRVRHELLPRLKKRFQPALAKVVLRQMEILGAESEFLDQVARDWRKQSVPADFNRLPVALQRRILHQELISLGVAAEFELVEELRMAPGREVMVAPGLKLNHDGQGQIQRLELQPVLFNDRQIDIAFAGRKGQGIFDGLAWGWEIGRPTSSPRPKFSAGCEWFDADRVGSQAVLRHWRAGDTFQPAGMSVPVKLQDLFTNLKIRRADRHRLAVAATAGGEIWWVEGLRIAERFKLSERTHRRLRWTWARRNSH